METGNPKQVAVLSVVAVCALGFVFTRLGGKSLPMLARAVGETSASPKASVTVASLPYAADPFSHPKLAPAKTVETNPETPLPGAGESFHGPFLPDAGTIGAGPQAPAASSGPLSPTEVTPTKPEKPAVSEGTLVALEATAGASDNVAFLAVDGKESQPYHPNDSIKGKVRLLRVEDGAVVLTGPKGNLTINVGERKRI